MGLRLMSALVLTVAWQATICGQELKADKWSGNPAETELVDLIDGLYKNFEEFYAQAAKITDRELERKYYEQNDPSIEFVPKLLAFESQHQGTDVGLMALRRVVLLAAGGGLADNAVDQGRRDTFKRLSNYRDRPKLVEIIRYLNAGNYEPATEEFLRSLAQDQKAAAVVREYSMISLASWMLGSRDAREYGERRMQDLESGAESRFPAEKDYYANLLNNIPDAPRLQEWEKEAIQLLRHSAQSTLELRQPALKGIDPKWHLIQIDEEATQKMPRLTELAEGLLFKESHLRIGKSAPDLEVSLVSGAKWSMFDQRGKVVIVQFSFKGCGPCEEMYPDLKGLQQTHGDRASILSIMADQDRKDTEEAVTAGKLSWNVAWDGWRGPLATRWAAQSFPTVYVVSPAGQIAGVGLRGKQLTNKVSELLQ